MKERILTSFLMLCLFTAQVHAQAVVESMKETNDFIPGNDQRKDYNNQLCALVKVQVVDDITDVEGSVMGDIISHGVEKWVYMAQNSRNMKIHLRNNLPVKIMFKDYDIQGLKSNRIYELVIKAPNAPRPQPSPFGQGRFQIHVTPINANIEVWGDNMGRQTHRANSDGMLSIPLPYGRYYYKVTATGYIETEGSVFIGDDTPVENITLKAPQGTLFIKCPTQNVNYYVDDVFAGSGGGKKNYISKLSPGRHTVTAKRNGYVSQEKDVDITIDQTTTLVFSKLIDEEDQKFEEQKKEKAKEKARIAALQKQQQAKKVEEQKKQRAEAEKKRKEKLEATKKKMAEKDKQSVVWGIKGGYNMASAQFDEGGGKTKNITGFYVGLTTEFRLANNFYLNTGLLYNSKGYEYENYNKGIEEKANPQYVEIPLQFSLHIPLGIFCKFELAAGPYVGYCIGGNVKDEKGSLYNETFSNAYNGLDYGLQVGGGFIISHTVRLGVDYQLGFDKKYQNRNLMFGIGFRF